MKQILLLHLHPVEKTETIHFLGQTVQINHRSCQGDWEQAQTLIAQYDGQVAAIGLEGLPINLQLGSVRRPHTLGMKLSQVAENTPIVDGSGIRAGLERWAVILADRAQPGIFSQKRALLVPGLNHTGLAQALEKRGCTLRYADPFVYFNLPHFPGIGTRQTLEQAASPTLEQLKEADFGRLYPLPQPAQRSEALFVWADLIVGDIQTIRAFAPPQLKGKTVVVEAADAADLADLRQRGASILVTLMPSLDATNNELGQWSAATLEAILVALRANPDSPLSEDTYLDLMADLDWQPAICYLQPDEEGINRFAFVIHPLNVKFIYKNPSFWWAKYLPESLIEAAAAYLPPLYLSKITGGQSPTTGQRIEGYLFSLGATPHQMMTHGERFTYTRLNQTARLAERKGARIMGLGAFTSVVGDAGITVAHEADIAITSGNSLTVAATLEAAKQAVVKMGAKDLTKGKVMIVGATGSIGAVCSRLLAQAINDVVLVSIEPERLIELKRTIQAETPGAQVMIATRPDDYLTECDLIVTATSAFGQRVVDITRCKPGAVICDVARPPDISAAEAALRPDVLVIESGEVLIPGDIDFGYDIGLPPKTSYACLAETALLAMEGRFEDYTLGRNITMERVKEIYHLFKKHQFQIAGLRSFGQYVTDDLVAEKRVIADKLRQDAELFTRTRVEAAAALAKIPVMAKGVKASKRPSFLKIASLVTAGLGLVGWFWSRRQHRLA
ncbi:MAG: serine carboxypeptidase [Chloroflexi bacterium]|nr:serine carboxypeptidase [Chloroflexota bacterium]MBP8056638.1 serine carboxypeptidase [Chloroflexota bacterium]